MEATVLSVGKSVVDGALSYAKSAVAEEVALQLGVQRDRAFITEELEMMRAFLMVAHEERDENKVIKTWVKQVRDVSYDVEDCLQDFAGRRLGKPTWWPWRIPRMLRARRRIGKQMKQLRARVEDVSQRNLRYNLIKGSGSKPTFNCEQFATNNSATMSSTDEAEWLRDKAKGDLVRLITKKDDNLRVISVWATNDDPGETSILRRAYEDLKKHKKFECCAWIKLILPFNPTKFLLSIVRQFYAKSLQDARERKNATMEGHVLRRMGMMKKNDLVDEFKRYVNEKNYLIVLDDLSNIEDWYHIRTYFPNKKGRSRIIVSTRQVEVASLCVGPENVEPEHRELCVDNCTLYAFYEKGSQDGTNSTEAGPSLNTFGSNNSAEIKTITRTETMVSVFKESQLIGREKEKADIIRLITNEDNQKLEVISVWGMGGLGKTALVRDVYQSQELIGKFEKRACVSIMRPFNPDDLLQSLAVQIDEKKSEKKEDEMVSEKNEDGTVEAKKKQGGEKKNKPPLAGLQGKKYLIVLDDLLFSTEWDAIKLHFPATDTTSRIIITTRVEKIAKHCSEKQHNVYKLKSLRHKDAQDLFLEKVFGRITGLDEQCPELVEQSNLILKKCNGLPLAIVTIGGFLANQPKVALEWMKLNRHISTELEMNPELETIIIVLNKSYDGLPYHLKSCFLYLSIFPEDHKISRRRLVRRWTAEGYSREFRGRSAEEIADNYFMDLISRSMILPSQQSIHSRKGIDSCQVHDLIREISISNSTEEKLVFRLVEGCSLNTQGTIRHLAINSNWEGDESEFENIVDLSRVRSVTVFGQWRSFFISDKMRLLRVLDMEDAFGVVDHHLEHVGKLIHLKYLSLRGCDGISHLPDSAGNLCQLETLDIRGTRIVKLPNSITNLQKLNCLRAGRKPMDEDDFVDVPAAWLLPIFSVMLCIYWCVPRGSRIDGMNRRDICTYFCCGLLPIAAMRLERYGVLVPRGMKKLKALHTLGVVNIAREKVILQDIRKLNRLCKLGVTGINKKNGAEFCSAIAGLGHLESLSIRAEGKPGLRDCLDGMSSPPKNLQSLKLYGNLAKLPEWIAGLKNLVKLKLRSTRIIDCDATIQSLGKIPNLTILCLCNKAFKGKKVHIKFHSEAFSSLVVLELESLNKLKLVEFSGGATPKLELLQFCGRSEISLFSGLRSLRCLNEVHLGSDNVGDRSVSYGNAFVEDLRTQLRENPNRPVLKRH
ncbi:unnamed protein product [Urochloa decumbens]|uniref:Disease resistance protein RPM1 n=1 Tax=Urochloa decumbens TaxID=240449 RepID=A0ABC9GZ05_9POAL